MLHSVSLQNKNRVHLVQPTLPVQKICYKLWARDVLTSRTDNFKHRANHSMCSVHYEHQQFKHTKFTTPVQYSHWARQQRRQSNRHQHSWCQCHGSTKHKHVTVASQTIEMLFNGAYAVATQACLPELFSSGQYLNSLVQDNKPYFEKAQPSPNTCRNERNLPCRQESLSELTI